jgi:lipoate---protein ligase
MQYLDLTLPTPEENLALDEALLDAAEQNAAPQEALRLWEPRGLMVVLGRSSRIDEEVHREACQADGVPILRRPSGGATILTGPGCLMYALVLSYELRPALRSVDLAHQFVLNIIASAIRPLADAVRCRGISDLALAERKISGNSVRCRKRHFLYHGTLLYRFPLELVGRYLRTPPRQPAYRAGRDHDSFLTNLPVDRAALSAALASAWQASDPCERWPREQTSQLVRERYALQEWNEGVS